MTDPLLASEPGVIHTLQCPPCESGHWHALFVVLLSIVFAALALGLWCLYRLQLLGVDRREIRSAAGRPPLHQQPPSAPASTRAYTAYARTLPPTASKLPLSHFSPV